MATFLYWVFSPFMWLTGIVLLRVWDSRITKSLRYLEVYDDPYNPNGWAWQVHLEDISWGLGYPTYRRIWAGAEVHGQTMSARHGFEADMVLYFQMTYFFFQVLREHFATAKRA